ncbi:MAG: glycoside hydrolase [Sedimentisphaerales bacterium]
MVANCKKVLVLFVWLSLLGWCEVWAEELSVKNAMISVTLNTDHATFSVTDKRTGHNWQQRPLAKGITVQDVKVEDSLKIKMTLLDRSSGMSIKAELALDAVHPEFTLTLSGKGQLRRSVRFPHPFITEPGTYLVVPMNEGISYPVEDTTISPRRLIAYGGHGICMAFWGVTDGRQGHMAIIETPDDAAIRMARFDGKLCVAPEWDSQKGYFGYTRRLRYIFFEQGGHVAMCKRYRSYARKAGLFKTLEQKLKENPNVDLLIGAVNVWCWEKDALTIVGQLKSLGIERILWSHRQPPEVIKAMNQMRGVLTSRYDIYQDLMDPQIVEEKLWRAHRDWTQEGWPNDLMLDANGNWRKGWRVKGKDGQMYPCGVLCDMQAPKYARQRVTEELKTHPYRCRFIDTTTASPWRECYHPDHPMTRSESRYWKMELLRFISEEMKLVTGSETGHDAAVPYVHYFEGMLSLGPYRVPDAGRNMIKIWDEVPERVAKFQVGHQYRLPLWELVYHDCVVAQWYWGDYNNKLPALWDKRDLFNILYGTPPMFMFNRQIWQRNKDRFAQSYKNICPIARAVGYAEMTDHRFLTPDRDVQQTIFSNGVTITVNFGDKPYRLPDDTELASMSYDVSGI